MNPPSPEPVQLLLEIPADLAGLPVNDEPGWELRAWVARKRRERNGEPMTLADREQATRQLEDL